MKELIKKYFLAMFLEKKDGEYAISFTRVLGSLAFVACMIGWVMELVKAGTVNENLVWTLWGLIGIKGAQTVSTVLKTPVQVQDQKPQGEDGP